MTRLDGKFVAGAQKAPVEYDHGDHKVRFQRTTARDESETGDPQAELEVTMGGHTIGYITHYTDEEHGAISAEQLGEIVPPTFRTVEGALEQLLPGVADGLATPTFVE
jgi:hypothetical protein